MRCVVVAMNALRGCREMDYDHEGIVFSFDRFLNNPLFFYLLDYSAMNANNIIAEYCFLHTRVCTRKGREAF